MYTGNYSAHQRCSDFGHEVRDPCGTNVHWIRKVMQTSQFHIRRILKIIGTEPNVFNFLSKNGRPEKSSGPMIPMMTYDDWFLSNWTNSSETAKVLRIHCPR